VYGRESGGDGGGYNNPDEGNGHEKVRRLARETTADPRVRWGFTRMQKDGARPFSDTQINT